MNDVHQLVTLKTATRIILKFTLAIVVGGFPWNLCTVTVWLVSGMVLFTNQGDTHDRKNGKKEIAKISKKEHLPVVQRNYSAGEKKKQFHKVFQPAALTAKKL